MEEITPITVSDATRLGPEEIYNKPKKAPKGETELTSLCFFLLLCLFFVGEDRRRNRAENKKIQAKKLQNKPKGKTQVALEQIQSSGQKVFVFVSRCPIHFLECYFYGKYGHNQLFSFCSNVQ